MSAPRESFDPAFALQLKNRTPGVERSTAISKSIQTLTNVLDEDDDLDELSDEDEDSAWQQLLAPVKFCRRVTLPANQYADVERHLRLNELFSREQEYLKKTQDHTLATLFKEEKAGATDLHPSDKSWIPDLTDGEHLQLLRAKQDQVRR